uniref:AIMP2 thioredoxin-like domain-containing protein n=1 Tax=Schistocephalus solidus TaxID=70667 RepID=A0A0X3NMK1_SCHSO
MYRVNAVVEPSALGITHTDSMYKCSPISSEYAFSSCNSPASVAANNISEHEQFDKFISKTHAPCSNLGRALHNRGDLIENSTTEKANESTRPFKLSSANAATNQMNGNEMCLDKFILRKTAARSELGKYLQSKTGQLEHGLPNPKVYKRLNEINARLDIILDAMHSIPANTAYVSTSIAHSPKMEEVMTERLQKLNTQASVVLSAMDSKVSPVAVSERNEVVVDLAIHCDPEAPPFAVFLFCKLLAMSGHPVSVQFYRHSSLPFFPKKLVEVERYFSTPNRLSSAKFILSVIWKPLPFGCKGISNPFTQLPVYGQTVILMLLARMNLHENSAFEILWHLESSFINGTETQRREYLKKFQIVAKDGLSILDAALFTYSIQSRLTGMLLKEIKPWFDKCMTVTQFSETKSLIESCM